MTDAAQWVDGRLIAFWRMTISCHGQHWWPCTVFWMFAATLAWSIAGTMAFGDPTWPVRFMAWLVGRG